MLENEREGLAEMCSHFRGEAVPGDESAFPPSFLVASRCCRGGGEVYSMGGGRIFF